MVFNLREDEIRIYGSSKSECCTRYSGAVVSGTYRRFFVIDPLQHASILGVHFRPGGATRILGLPARELAGLHVDLASLWGSAATDLRERLCAALTTADRFFVIEQALLERLGRAPAMSDLISAALDAFGRGDSGIRVRDVARHVGLSQRRFIQVFAEQVGLTPKLYCRVRRFQQAHELMRAASTTGGPTDGATIAATCGYFDQSHLTRDFREFAGLTPGAFSVQSTDRVLPSHVPQAG